MSARRKFAIVPLLLLVVPLVEIALFVVIGQEIGVWWTLASVFITAIVGTALLRFQGLRTFQAIQRETQAGQVPARQLVHAFLLLIAGILLLTPGFFTDAIGFALFVPALRDGAWTLLKGRLVGLAATVVPGGAGPSFDPASGSGAFGRGGPRRPSDGVVDLGADDYEVRPPPSGPRRD